MKTGDLTRIILLFIICYFIFLFWFHSIMIALICAYICATLGYKYRKYQHKRDIKVDLKNIDSAVLELELEKRAEEELKKK